MGDKTGSGEHYNINNDNIEHYSNYCYYTDMGGLSLVWRLTCKCVCLSVCRLVYFITQSNQLRDFIILKIADEVSVHFNSHKLKIV